MILHMIDTRGRARIAELVRAAIAWRRTSAAKVGAMPGRPGIATIDRVKAGDEVSDTMLRALGDKLGLPPDYLLYVGAGDIERIRRSGADPAEVQWTVDLIEADRPNGPGHRRSVIG